jgi:hypothetical protein
MGNTLDAHLRTQLLKQSIESELNLYDQLDLVDLEIAPLALQYAAISGKAVVCRDLTRMHRFENKILSMIEEG